MDSGLPHSGQRVRLANDEYRVFFMDDGPDAHGIGETGNQAKLRNGAPERRRQVWTVAIYNARGEE